MPFFSLQRSDNAAGERNKEAEKELSSATEGGHQSGKEPVVSWGIQSGGREEGLSKGLGRPLASSSLVDHSQDTGFSSDTRSQEDSWWKGDRF